MHPKAVCGLTDFVKKCKIRHCEQVNVEDDVMDTKSGSISISTENIFPIIKKWLYSEKDIFLREIISNGSDAINKLKKLIAVGEADLPEETCQWRLEVSLDKEAGTVTVHDNGIGMTEEEVYKYINQVAFSGVKDFMEKYRGKTDDAQIIGHFGLGFYSAFMVADKVEIDTLSWQPGAEAVHWESETGMDYTVEPSDITERGTYITIHLAEDCQEYLDASRIKETVKKYFGFLPIELYFIDVGTDSVPQNESEAPKPINNTEPLWLKMPKDCTDEEYIQFYHEVFFDYHDPLFWIHLNTDYPFRLKGILYFPKLKGQYDSLEGTIKIYYNQVFVADNIKEILPEFLMLLKGTIDCPDLPLNVSRSFLQNDGYVNKISQHITKKIADKLCGLFHTERENYCKYWDDINPFVKYGCLKDEKFFDRVKDVLLFKLTDGTYQTLSDFTGDRIYYTDNPVQQAQYIKMFEDTGIEPAVLDGPIDTHFMQLMEYKNPGKVKFDRIDAGVSDKMKQEDPAASREDMDKLAEKLAPVFRQYAGNDKLHVSVESMKTEMAGILLLSEQSRRMQEMAKMYGDGLGLPLDDDITLVLNGSNALVSSLGKMEDEETAGMICQQIYDLAKLAHQPLSAEELTRFLDRSGKILARAVENKTK